MLNNFNDCSAEDILKSDKRKGLISSFIAMLRNLLLIVMTFWVKIKQNAAFIAIASLLWLLLQSGRRPSRISYPCQKAAAANVLIFLPFAMLPMLPLYNRIRNYFKKSFNLKKILKSCLFVLLVFLAMVFIDSLVQDYMIRE